MKEKHNLICKFVGGSHLYNLQNAESDIDYRGAFLSEDISYIVGLDKTGDCDHATKIDGDDHTYYELRRLMQLLRKTNTASIEFLFVPDSRLLETSDIFDTIRKNKHKFVNSAFMVSSTRGYVQGERRLALGERTGNLGSKRKAQLDKYGFSPKNVTQIIRIVVAAQEFLKNGYYPLDISEVDKVSFKLAKLVKNSPESFKKEDIVAIIDDYEKVAMGLEDKVNLVFDNDAANQLLCEAYFKTIKNYVV